MTLALAPVTDDRRWTAVVNRDARADGAFVYAVRSTRIYCRPSCPSRRPQRARVLFFPRPAEAEAAGFRPCLRCRPNEAARDARLVALVERTAREIERTADAPPKLVTLATSAGVPPAALARAFQRTMGISPRAYAEACRMARLRARLHDGVEITRALYDSGLGSPSRLYERAPTQLGMTPATYQQGGRGAHVRWSTARTPLGRLLVAGTDRGVCAVLLGASDRELGDRLASELPAATRVRDDRALRPVIAHIVRHLEGKEPHLDLPLDIRATAFQRRVWQALRRIPYGETRSYAQVARAVGAPTATRAVARACASNPVALVVPCHRVVRSDGTMGGYRWGLERKRALLERERKTATR